MGETQPEVKISDLTMDGLDEFLDQGPTALSSVQGKVDSEGWTIQEAASYLNLSEKTIRRYLKKEKLDGYLVDGPNGPEWRIKQTTLDNDQGQQRPQTIYPTMVQGGQVGRVENTLDSTLVRDLLSKVEALTYRNGYLEAQLENHKEQIKLLTDSQHKPSWWRRFGSWLTGKS